MPEEAALMRYAVVIEKANSNYSAYVPDLPGCVATGDTAEAVEREIRDAIRLHIEGLKEDGLPVPAPTSSGRVCRGISVRRVGQAKRAHHRESSE